jgi:chitinase
LDYPADAISKSLDWINVVAYDFYNPALSWNKTGPLSGLHSGNADNETPPCGDAGITAWLTTIVPARKIVLGLPFYGAAWLLQDEKKTEIFAPANGAADGEANGVHFNISDGTILYNQIKYFIEKHSSGKAKHSEDYVVDYFSHGTTWIGYNDTKSIKAKVEYAKEKALLGYYAWHVGGDRKWILSTAGYNYKYIYIVFDVQLSSLHHNHVLSVNNKAWI